MILLLACSTPEGPILFAAASTRSAVEEALESWSGPPVRSSYAATSLLARQIEAGAPADVFLAAHPEWLEAEPFLSNRMVLVGEGEGCVLVADEHVPAGRYAREALDAEFISAPDAPAVRVMFDQGICPRAALYATDAEGLSGTPLEVGAIEYPMAALTEAGADLEAHLRSQKPTFEAHGFQ